MALFRKKKDINLGNVSIGDGDVPSKVDADDPSVQKRQREIKEDTKRKIEEYRKENPEKPKTEKKTEQIDAPLRIKRSLGSFDDEYVDIAKRYLGMPNDHKPTVVELSKGIIKLFEDNAKLYSELSKLRETSKGVMKNSPKHSWEHNSSWN
jgi:hypothetical protein